MCQTFKTNNKVWINLMHLKHYNHIWIKEKTTSEFQSDNKAYNIYLNKKD